MDNFYTGSAVLALARGFFHATEALVYDTDDGPVSWSSCDMRQRSSQPRERKRNAGGKGIGVKVAQPVAPV